jgi:hypothetical protein
VGGGGGFNFGAAPAAGRYGAAPAGGALGGGGFNFGGGAAASAAGPTAGGFGFQTAGGVSGMGALGGMGGMAAGALVPGNMLGQAAGVGLPLGGGGAMMATTPGQTKVNYDLHHLSFEKLKQRGGGNQLIDALIKRVNATQRLVDDVDNAARNIKMCSLPMQLERLSELKAQVYDVALDWQSVENERKRQETAVSGRRGLKEELKVFSRDQRYASIAARNLEHNFNSRIAPTDFFQRLYANLCEQMNELQQQIYEVESVVNPEAFRASVARDRNAQIRRKKWSTRNREGDNGAGNKAGGQRGMLDMKDDSEYDGGMSGDDMMMTEDLVGDLVMGISASQSSMLQGNTGFSSQLRYNVADAVRHRNHVAYGRGVEAAEQGAIVAHRARMLANRRRGGGVGGGDAQGGGGHGGGGGGGSSGGGGGRGRGGGGMNAGSRGGAGVGGAMGPMRGEFSEGNNLRGGRMSAQTLEHVLQSQYRSFLDTAARVAKVHEVVKQMRNVYLEAINSPEGGARARALQAIAVGANSRREMNRIGANKLRSRPYGIDPFADATRKEENELQKQSRRRQQEVYRGLAKPSLEKQRSSTSQGAMPAIAGAGTTTSISGMPGFGSTANTANTNAAGAPTLALGGAAPAAAPAAGAFGMGAAAPAAGGFSFGGGAAKPLGQMAGGFGAPAALQAGAVAMAGGGGGGFNFGGAAAAPTAPAAGGFKF